VLFPYRVLHRRILPPNDADKVTGKEAVSRINGLPGIWFWAPTIDRLKMITDEGWKVYKRIIGGSVINTILSPESQPQS
jgi:hypothetical protein